jgi:hypothetical protein
VPAEEDATIGPAFALAATVEKSQNHALGQIFWHFLSEAATQAK